MIYSLKLRHALVLIGLGSSAYAGVDPRITEYLTQLKSQPSEVNIRLAQEIERSLELSNGPEYDALDAKRLIPDFFADLFGHNGWQSRSQASSPFILEPFFFHPQSSDFANLDLTRGFGRTETLSSYDGICTYVDPKKGAGTRPGYKLDCDGMSVRAKFKEIHTQALATRIFWALGFNVDPADYHAGIKVAYNRRIFSEFNSRTGVDLKLKFGRKQMKVATLNPKYDAFEHVAKAVLKDGSSISGAELKGLYLAETDQNVAYIVTQPAQVTISWPKSRSVVGPWSFNDFDHAQSKVLRSVAILSAWLAIYDIRRDNNLLVIDHETGVPTLKFMFPDLGSGLGSSRYRVSLLDKIEDVKKFRSKVASRGKIRGAQVNEENDAFITATREDLRFGVQLINQFSESQLRDLLVASGYSGDELDQYLKKLISRRESLNTL